MVILCFVTYLNNFDGAMFTVSVHAYLDVINVANRNADLRYDAYVCILSFSHFLLCPQLTSVDF